MKNKIFLWSLRIIFLLSLFSIFYCGFQLLTSQSQIDAALQQWDNKASKTTKSSLTTIQFNEKEPVQKSPKNIIKEPPTSSPLYTTAPAKGDVIGKIIIPKLKMEFPLIEGTDERELAKGVGHYSRSVLPGEKDNTVLAGHRDTVFRNLKNVKIGDIIEIKTGAGTFTYKITKQRIVHKDDRTVIVPYDRAVLTLITCYPFNFIGSAPDRFILIGEKVE